MQNFLSPGERTDQHDQCGLGEMEVGNQAVQNAEAITGVDEDFGVAALRAQCSVLIRRGFEGAAARRADTYNATARRLCAVHSLCGFLAHHIELLVHMVLQNVLLLHRAEGAESHVEGHTHNDNALLRKTL